MFIKFYVRVYLTFFLMQLIFRFVDVVNSCVLIYTKTNKVSYYNIQEKSMRENGSFFSHYSWENENVIK